MIHQLIAMTAFISGIANAVPARSSNQISLLNVAAKAALQFKVEKEIGRLQLRHSGRAMIDTNFVDNGISYPESFPAYQIVSIYENDRYTCYAKSTGLKKNLGLTSPLFQPNDSDVTPVSEWPMARVQLDCQDSRTKRTVFQDEMEIILQGKHRGDYLLSSRDQLFSPKFDRSRIVGYTARPRPTLLERAKTWVQEKFEKRSLR